MQTIIRFFNNLGPGILAASAAIGASHLVQATRAGGYFGFELLWIVVAVNIIKYPFIEYGFRYAGATGKNLLQAYQKLNPKFTIIFIITNVISAIGAIALLSYLCGGIFKSVLGINIDIKFVTLFIMLLSCAIVMAKNYDYLDNIMKIFMIFLFFSTLCATIFSIINFSPEQSNIYYTESAWSSKNLPFIIALIGWMPGPMEIGVWYSVWLQAKNRGKHKINFQQAKFDFNFGYILMILTAIFFITLGALVLHHSGQEISSKATVFTSQLISIYTLTIGDWSKIIIAVAILTTIFSTTITVIDIYPRTISCAIKIIKNEDISQDRPLRNKITVIFCLLAFIIIYFFVNNFMTIADVVTITAFVFAPFFAFLNYKVVTSKLLPKKYHPNIYMKVFNYFSILLMIILVIFFAISRLGT
jgi:Mn2+/Fe2+ NRAMP family transporter